MGHTSFQLDRRQFLRAGITAAGGLAFSPAFLERALGAVTLGQGYGPLQPFDANGIALPAGFTSRQIARGQDRVPGTSYVWHAATDGQATFPTLTNGVPDGGWILTANSEFPLPGQGGVSAVEFDREAKIERAYRVLSGTAANCAGGPTPWGRWLSCEEHDEGMVHECDPTTLNAGVARPAMGVFAHEAACVDPVNQRIYLTEDKGDGCLYRFTPTDYPDLTAGLLEVATGTVPGTVTWTEVPNPQGGAAQPTRQQVPAAAHFNGGEGTWFHEGIVYFTTKGDSRVWTLNVATNQIEILYDEAAVGPGAPLSGVDNITVSPAGEIFVCEDGRDHDICLITPNFEVSRFLKLDPVMHSGPPPGSPFAGNETVGVVFSPDGASMYFGGQRSFPVGGNPSLPAGVVYEVTGPFKGANPDRGPRGAPKVKLRVKRRRAIRKFIRTGLPIHLELDQPVGVSATLREAVGRGKGEKAKAKRGPLLASAKTSVAVSGSSALVLKPAKSAPRRLSEGETTPAILRVVVTNAAKKQTVLRRKVTLGYPKKDRD